MVNKVRAALDRLDPPADDGRGGHGPVHYSVERGESTVAGLWQPWYEQVRPGRPGDEAALAKRHHAIAPRLANIYAVLDQAPKWAPEHLRAGMAWTQYSFDTTQSLFGTEVPGHARRLLDAIRQEGAKGLAGTGQQKALFGHRDVKALRADLEGARADPLRDDHYKWSKQACFLRHLARRLDRTYIALGAI